MSGVTVLVSGSPGGIYRMPDFQRSCDDSGRTSADGARLWSARHRLEWKPSWGHDNCDTQITYAPASMCDFRHNSQTHRQAIRRASALLDSSVWPQRTPQLRLSALVSAYQECRPPTLSPDRPDPSFQA